MNQKNLNKTVLPDVVRTVLFCDRGWGDGEICAIAAGGMGGFVRSATLGGYAIASDQ
ncbi:hypothetical protein [Nostoc sp.]|uniref:hypothetical protein n=1 Tax=Nostoc sp. TaxID=1180 RepID=UPI002FFD2377